MNRRVPPSIYPDFFKSGLDKLRRDGAGGADVLALLTALEQFQNDIREHDTAPEILRVTQLYLAGLDLFQASAYYLVNPMDLAFELTACDPEAGRADLDQLVQAEMRSGKFAWALRQRGPVFFHGANGSGGQGVFHSLAVSTQVEGMFCGLWREERMACQEITLRLLSILLGTCSYALAEARNTAQLKHKILATNKDLQRTLRENQVLARIPAESPSPILRLSRAGRVLYANEAGQALLAGLGHQVGDFVVGEWLGRLDAAVQGSGRNEFEITLGERVFSFLVAAVPEADYANFYGTDITARKRIEAELRQANEAAQDASRAKSEFLANMSHEIRTPMNAVLGFTELLDRLVREPRQRQYLAAITSSGKTLLTLIEDILDLSKIEAGKLRLEYEPVCLPRVIEEVCHIFSEKAATKGLRLAAELSQDLPSSLLLDEARLRQILFNTLGNALKFTERGHVLIRARARPEPTQPPRITLELEVEDTGIGIAPTQQEHIFEAFSQASGQSTKKYGGTGLGLTITRRLTQMMGGTVALDSAPGRGSRFTFTWPGVAVVAAPNPSLPPPAATEEPPAFRPGRILVVDDVPLNADLLKEMLRDTPLDVVVGASGEEALALARQQHPDLILMDIRMAGLDGLEATERLRADPLLRHIPVLAVTASLFQQEQGRVLAVCNGLLSKPIQRRDLFAQLCRFLPLAAPVTAPAPAIPETPPTETATIFEPAAPARWGPLLEHLHREEHQVWPALTQTLAVGRIRDFAARLGQWGREFQAPPLAYYATALTHQSEAFDTERLNQTLSTFPGLIAQLEASRNHLAHPAAAGNEASSRSAPRYSTPASAPAANASLVAV